MTYSLSAQSRTHIEGVHTDLVRVVERAIEISEVDFAVIEGLRTPERQEELVSQGKSTTLHSRHLTGHAVDLAAIVNGMTSWGFRYYRQIASAMKTAASELDIEIEWGGDWPTFRDGPHFQLSREQYP